MAPIVVCMAGLVVMIALTQTLDVREGRWWKIAVSLPLILLITAPFSSGLGLLNGVALILSISFLGFIWSGTISCYASGLLLRILHGDANVSAGHIPDFQFARARIDDGDFEDAIKLTLHELEKNPNNYEGLMLLARLYFQMHRPDEALKQIEAILQNPDTTPEQIERATAAKIECLNELNRRGIKTK